MSPVDARIKRLLAEIGADREGLRAQYAILRELADRTLWQDGAPESSVAAVSLHHYYTAAEAIFERIARAFEGLPEAQARWHQTLLDDMALTIEGVRAPVLRKRTTLALRELLGFRHFFRHAYAVSLSAERLHRLAALVRDGHEELENDLNDFAATLAHS